MSSDSGSSPARHRAVALGSSAEVLYNPHKPLHFSLLDADKLNPNHPFILPVHKIQDRCGFNLKQRVTVRLIDPEAKKLTGRDRGVRFYRTALSRQVDHGSHPRHLLTGKGQLEPNRKPYILSKVIVADEAAPPPLKGEKSVRAELAAKGIDAEEAPKSLAQALASRLMNKVFSTVGAMRKPHRKSSILTIKLDHLPRHLSPTPHKLLGLLSSQSVVTALIQGNRLFKVVIGEF